MRRDIADVFCYSCVISLYWQLHSSVQLNQQTHRWLNKTTNLLTAVHKSIGSLQIHWQPCTNPLTVEHKSTDSLQIHQQPCTNPQTAYKSTDSCAQINTQPTNQHTAYISTDSHAQINTQPTNPPKAMHKSTQPTHPPTAMHKSTEQRRKLENPCADGHASNTLIFGTEGNDPQEQFTYNEHHNT